MKKYLEDLEKELRKSKISDEEILEIMEDHKEMIEIAKQEGISDDELEKKFGNPKKVAEDLTGDYQETAKIGEKGDLKMKNINSCVRALLPEDKLYKTFTPQEDYEVEIALVSEDIQVDFHDEDLILIYKNKVKNLEDFNMEFSNNKLVLTRKSKKMKFVIGFSSRSEGSFYVLLPKKLQVTNYSLKTVSSDGCFNGINTSNVKISTTSGDNKLTNITTEAAKVSTVSGNLNIKGFNTKSFDLSTVSGDICVEEMVVEENIHVNSVSGDINFKNGKADNLDLKTVSGDGLLTEFYPLTVSLKSVSGDIVLNNENRDRYVEVIYKKSVSGDIIIK